MLQSRLGISPARWLLVHVAAQRLSLILENRESVSYRMSTAAAGINSQEDSFGTPPGVHTVSGKIGEGMPSGTVFKSRTPTGEVWQPGRARQSPASQGEPRSDLPGQAPAESEDLILSRILTLKGEEPGVNRGEGCDSEMRHIYIHGTNHEDRLGAPVSHGCIRLSNSDVIDLFARVQEGDPVVII
jgi:UDP-N-acetylmuramate--alanine ligase